MITAEQRDMMRHALGLDRQPKPYRNNYCAGDADIPAWEDLVAKGLAVLLRKPEQGWAGPVYGVTEAGKALILGSGEAELEASK